ncbi:MAG: sn-glycerol-3-phosphate ABC transporter substrate-binding protein UgpB [Acidocella sp.]|nr:sn-glycerol-3-phosphate ABC transporter substrate-binding protein UgpB [Acidocella sp.]
MKRRTILSTAAAAATLPAMARAADGPTAISFWHAMPGQLGEEVNSLTDSFNKSQSDYVVQPVYKGVYADNLTATIAAWRAGTAPHISQVFDVGTATMMSAASAVVDVAQLSAKTGVTIDPNSYVPSIRGYYALNDGKMAGLPFNSSTVVMWLNLDAFEHAGLDTTKLPTTWPEVIAAARAIKEKNSAPVPMMSAWPTWAHFEEFAAIHNVEFASLNNGFGGADAKLNISAAPFVRNLQRLLDAEKEGIFKYLGRDNIPSPTFFSGKAGIGFDSSGILGQLRKSATFRYAAAYLPYDPKIIAKPINSIIGGAALWAMTAPNRSATEYKGIAKFFAFLGQPENDAGFSQSTGYVPVTHAGYQQDVSSGYYEKTPGADVAIKQLARQPTTNYSRGIRLGGMPQIRIIIEAAWEGAIASGASAASVLADAQTRGDAVIKSFART